MMPAGNSLTFRREGLQDNKLMSDDFFPPDILSELLAPESTLLSATEEYGKSTISTIARRKMESQWLNINLEQLSPLDINLTVMLLEQITLRMLEHIEANPESLANLGVRVNAVRYFLNRYYKIKIDYLLSCLIEDNPLYAHLVQLLKDTEPGELFNPKTTYIQQLKVLCECIQRMGMKGVIIWINVDYEFNQFPHELLQVLQSFFALLKLVPQRTLYIKCSAPVSVCNYLHGELGEDNLNVKKLLLSWSQEQLVQLIEQRLQLATNFHISSIEQLINLDKIVSFLSRFSDVENPSEWLRLFNLIARQLEDVTQHPITEQVWLNVQRSYCSEYAKIWMDEEGRFWRGKHLLAGLTSKKRAIYPLVKYLYENPGMHRTYNLARILKIDENNLNTIVNRARKEHLEPFMPTDKNKEDMWIYLVTDLKGGGYALMHTVHS